MSEKTEYRRNAAERAIGGGVVIGAGAGLKHHADKKFVIPNGKVERKFRVISPEGFVPREYSVYEDKMVKPTIKHAIKNKKFTANHAKFLGTKAAARSVQGAGIGLAVAGGKQFYNGQKNEKFSVKREVVRPLIHADVIENKVNQHLSKSTDQEKLIRSKERTRRYLQVGGAIGGTALALRTPEFASALKRAPKSKILLRAKELEPKTTKASNSLLAVGSGIGAAGALNSAHMQKLETRHLKTMSKSDDKDRKKIAAGTAAGVGLGVGFPTLQKTPSDNGASARINTKLGQSTKGTVDIADVRGIARTPGKRYGAEQNQAKLTSRVAREGFKESHPIEVSRYANGQMVVTNGHHRLRAAEDLGHTEIPVRVRNETGKAPRSVVPLYRSGRFVRDVVDARQPRKALDAKGRQEMEALAAKDVPKHIERANKLKSLSEEIPHNLNTPRNKVLAAAVGAAGIGAYGSRKTNDVSKRDDKFLREYRNRISPQAEQGYKYLKSGARGRQVDATVNAGLGAGLLTHAGQSAAKKHYMVAGLEGTTGLLSLKAAHHNANEARAWNSKVNAIKAKAKQREAEGIYGKDRHVDMAKSIMVEKGLSVGLPYPKGVLRRSGLRAGHLMRTASGKTVFVRGSVG